MKRILLYLITIGLFVRPALPADLTISANINTFLGAADFATAKSLLSLGNVENTALSTWAGSTSITTLGTVNAPTFSGIVTSSGANVRTPNAMGALVIDVTKMDNSKSVNADTAFTFSGTPASSNTYFGIWITNSGSTARTISLPANVFSVSQNGTITTVTLPASGYLWLVFYYDGSIYRLNGDPALTSGTGGSYALTASPAFTGTPTAPTAATTDNSTTIATTAFVKAAVLQSEATLTDGATITQTMVATQADQNAKVTLGGNRTLAFASLAAGMRGNLRVIQDGTGSRTLALPSNSRVNGSTTTVTLLTAAAAENILSWYSPDGTAIRWTNGTY